jgi:DNA-binding GntR family transcriptional regulator
MSSSMKTESKTRGRPKGTGAQMVHAGIRSDILHLRLAPGTNLEEASLEKRYGVSRTPVREALIRLASDGLITLLPNRGAQVAQIDISEVPQFFEVMDVCQRMVLCLCANRRTEEHIEELRDLNESFANAAKSNDVVAMSEINHEFHLVTARACGNKYVRAQYEELLSIGLRLARSAFGTAIDEPDTNGGYFGTVVDQHGAMIDALSRNDAIAAEALGRQHTDLFRQRIMRSLEANLGQQIKIG